MNQQENPGTKPPHDENRRVPRSDPKHPQKKPGRAPQKPPDGSKAAHPRTWGARRMHDDFGVDCFA